MVELPPEPFQMKIDHDGRGTATVRLAGAFAADAHERFAAELFEVEWENPTDLILDLREVTFIDSGAMRTIAELWHRSQDAGYALGIVVEGSPAEQAFELAGLETLPFVRPGERPGEQEGLP